MANTFLNRHFNGPYSQSIADGIQGSFDATNELTTYLHDLNIDNAEEQELEWIGLWIGFKRPFIPDEFILNDVFLAFSLADQTDQDALPLTLPHTFLGMRIISSLHGACSLANPYPIIGGEVISLNSTQTKLSLDIYRQILKSIAFIKWNGWNFLSLDNLLYQNGIDYSEDGTGINYTFSWDSANDIVVTFSKSIKPVYIYIFSLILDIFVTLPRVTLVGA